MSNTNQIIQTTHKSRLQSPARYHQTQNLNSKVATQYPVPSTQYPQSQTPSLYQAQSSNSNSNSNSHANANASPRSPKLLRPAKKYQTIPASAVRGIDQRCRCLCLRMRSGGGFAIDVKVK
ncbi:hypothetical protein BofuT4_P081940.1 [Botrytis cinerea T4]|uniref:Uncharacterized protein n=1 Tax=Botryotinia fuckeliana (strain T4) TaxID=999810 RepID=G2YK87_BOTF4|nr:hypothetical protein BofuT4_P081940.1 [Botrytis cinerea T4]